MSKSTVLKLTESSVFAAIMCILSPISIAIGPVPITLSIFALVLTAVVLPRKQAVYAVLVYLLLGACGLPVFSGAAGGIAKLVGPTGGYLVSYPLLVYIAGIEPKFIKNTFLRFLVFSFFGLLACYAFGTVWFMIVMKKSLITSLTLCVFPFIPADTLKIFAACLLGTVLKKRISFLNL